MKLREIAPADAELDARHADIEVRGVTADSRTAKRGDVFVAITGGKTDGGGFIEASIAAGAVAIIAERAPIKPLPSGIGFMRVANSRPAVAWIASRFCARQPPQTAAVTRTSCNTAAAAITRSHWSDNGR